MADEAVDSFQRWVLGLPLSVWRIGGAVAVIGLAIAAVLWAIVSGKDVQTIIGLVTLVGILATAIGTLFLAVSTRDMAKATSDSVNLQRREFEAARQAAGPELEVSATYLMPSAPFFHLRWIKGSEPAYEVTAWLRQADGYFWQPVGTLTAGQSQQLRIPGEFILIFEGHLDGMWPFKQARLTAPTENERWVGITWLSADDIRGRSLRFIRGREIVVDLRGEKAR